MRTLLKASTEQPLVFLLIQSSDHITGLTGATPTVTLSKNGGTFAAPSGAVTEIANGWYKVAANATDTGTLGPLILHAAATGSDPTDIYFDVVGYDPQDALRLGLSALPASGTIALTSTTLAANVVQIGGAGVTALGAVTYPSGTLALASTTMAANLLQIAGTAVVAPSAVTFPSTIASPTNITAGTITTVSGNVTGSVGSVTGAVGSVTGNVGGTVTLGGGSHGGASSTLTLKQIAVYNAAGPALNLTSSYNAALPAGQGTVNIQNTGNGQAIYAISSGSSTPAVQFIASEPNPGMSLDYETLSQFAQIDTGQTSAVAGSVSQLSQGANSSSVATFLSQIKAKTDQITAGGITISTFTTSSAQLNLVRGDDYKAADGRAIVFSVSQAALSMPAGTTVRIVLTDLSNTGTTYVTSGSYTANSTTNNYDLSFDIPRATTAAMIEASSYRYDVQAVLADGDIATIAQGKAVALNAYPNS